MIAPQAVRAGSPGLARPGERYSPSPTPRAAPHDSLHAFRGEAVRRRAVSQARACWNTAKDSLRPARVLKALRGLLTTADIVHGDAATYLKSVESKCRTFW